MLGYIVSGFLRFLCRIWTFGLFYFLENRWFLWLKDTATPQLSYKTNPPFCEPMTAISNYKGVDSELCLLKSSSNSWNKFFLSSLGSSKKFPFNWIAKTVMFSSYPTVLPFSMKRCILDKSAQTQVWNLKSVTGTATVGDKNFNTDAMFGDESSVVPVELLPSCFGSDPEKIGFIDYSLYKEFYDNILQKEKEKLGLLKPVDTDLCVTEQHCSSVASIDSGYRSFPSVESSYKCIEEDGITLFVSDCQYNKEGKLISMTVGFGSTEDSTSSDSLTFDPELSDNDSDCESDDESEEDFIVFDADSCCDEADDCFFDRFVFEGTADEISLAMSVNNPRHSSFEVRITQMLPSSDSCGYCNENNCDKLFNDYKCVANKTICNEKDDTSTSETRIDNSVNSAGTVQAKKRVHFQVDVEIHEIIAWDFAYREARKGHWKNYATDRLQFQRRIEQTAKVVEPVLQKKILQMKN